jgi:hypothetical protein
MNSVADVPSFDFLSIGSAQKKTGNRVIVAGFTIRSLRPLVTTLGCQFIASTTFQEKQLERAQCTERASGNLQMV